MARVTGRQTEVASWLRRKLGSGGFSPPQNAKACPHHRHRTWLDGERLQAGESFPGARMGSLQSDWKCSAQSPPEDVRARRQQSEESLSNLNSNRPLVYPPEHARLWGRRFGFRARPNVRRRVSQGTCCRSSILSDFWLPPLLHLQGRSATAISRSTGDRAGSSLVQRRPRRA